MRSEYRIERAGKVFLVVDDWGEELVDKFSTEEEAKRAIADCKKEDALWETAERLVKESMTRLMHEQKVDSATARYWISSAAEALE